MRFDKRKAGFTLVEIVVVISIMAVLTAVIYSSFDASKALSRDQQRVSDISTIQLALEQYFYKYGVYPVTLADSKFIPAFLYAIPTPPLSSDSPYQNNYIPITKTFSSEDCISYQLWTSFERNNSYLESKKGFNSMNLAIADNPGDQKTLYECGGNGNHNSAKIDASSTPLVYDVMP